MGFQNLITKTTMQELMQTQSTFATEKKNESLDIFNSVQSPKEKDEDWRYTQIGKLNLQKFSFSQAKTGILATKLSEDLIEKGVILTDINTALDNYPIAQDYFFKSINAKNDKLNALNLSFFAHGIFL